MSDLRRSPASEVVRPWSIDILWIVDGWSIITSVTRHVELDDAWGVRGKVPRLPVGACCFGLTLADAPSEAHEKRNLPLIRVGPGNGADLF